MRFGEILLEAKLVTAEVLEKALENQKGTRKRLGQILEEGGELSEKDIAIALARQFGYKTVSGIANHNFSQEVLATLDGATALNKYIFPLRVKDKTLMLAMVNPLDIETIDRISFRVGMRIVPCVTTPNEIRDAAKKHYFQGQLESGGDWWTILVVDDQPMASSAIAAALQREGYTVVRATNGADGVQAANQYHPHLILSEIVMLRMDGYEMVEILKKNRSTATIPVIFQTSRSTAEEEAKALDQGIFDFVPKPLNPVRLCARVRRALRQVYGDIETPPV